MLLRAPDAVLIVIYFRHILPLYYNQVNTVPKRVNHPLLRFTARNKTWALRFLEQSPIATL